MAAWSANAWFQNAWYDGAWYGVVVTAEKPKGRKKRRRRYSVEVEGEIFIFDSIPEVQQFMAQIQETAEQAAEQDIPADGTPKKPPRIRVLTRTGKPTQAKAIQAELVSTRNILKETWDKIAKQRRDLRKVDIEIAELLQAKIFKEEVEEEAIILLLFTE